MASSINASTSGAGGVITTADATGTLQLQSASTTVATINAYGIGLGTGVPSSGIGITFPATQSASSDANTLDDYEEGTYTPSMTSTAATITFGNQQGYYTKIGNIVFASGYMSVSGVSGTTTNPVLLSGLPFTTKNQGNDGASCVFGVETFTAIPTAFTQPGSTSFNIYVQGGVTTMKASQIQQSFYLYTAIYQTA